ncbi:uncharacterized protein LOC129608094 [Condylostylus longicornis]|uniref:uncharacterized protein LOC129608094 n=1 Tax=Condylostylus longicornis TaxID=2530218 RepID=UPI00244DA90F|nr:uncharacterized protein LOC129608094 [Condylostylus longicornis]
MSGRIFNPKLYSNVYKKLLVEELVFIENYLDFHYGNCAVIGKIFKDECSYFLENIRLSCLGREHEIPEGSVKVRLLTNLYGDFIPDKKTAEVYGNAVFYNINSPNENQMPVTLQDIYYQFNKFCDTNEIEVENLDVDNMKKIFNQSLLDKYEPAIQIRFINLCDQPAELIAYNLEIRHFS